MTRKRRGTPKDPERAREALLAAALRRFSEKGYRGTRMADVAADAGYSEALVYFHFGTKADLFQQVVSHIDAESTWLEHGESRERFVRSMHDGELRYHLDARWRALDRVWSEALAGEPDLLRMIQPELSKAVDAVEARLATFERVPHPRRRALALFLMGMSYGTRVLRRYDPDVVSPEDAADLLAWATDLAIDALEGKGPPLRELAPGSS